MTYEELRKEARKRPVAAELNELSEIYLKDFNLYGSEEKFNIDLHDPNFMFKEDVIVNSSSIGTKIPFVETDLATIDESIEEWINWEKDRKILKKKLLNQSEIKDYILENHSKKDVVVLIIIDGLSYEKCRKISLEAKPIFVDGISKTSRGYLRTVYGDSNTSVAAELVTGYGFKKSVGFAYWDRDDNELNSKLNESITNNEYYNMDDFSEVIERIQDIDKEDMPCFVQVTLQGLDQGAHHSYGRPDNKGKLKRIESNIRSLEETIAEKTDNYSVLATADHGLLWKEDFQEKSEKVKLEDYNGKPRYQENIRKCPEEAIIIEDNGKKFGMLPFPYKYRTLNNNEWGIHGGFSYYESITPLIELEG